VFSSYLIDIAPSFPTTEVRIKPGTVHAGDLNADHIVPSAEGGTDDLDNLQTLCVPCHNTKTLQEAARGRQRWHQRGKRKPPLHPTDAYSQN
jgi:5-methylcytosine-specific restriction endonuclease McrA